MDDGQRRPGTHRAVRVVTVGLLLAGCTTGPATPAARGRSASGPSTPLSTLPSAPASAPAAAPTPVPSAPGPEAAQARAQLQSLAVREPARADYDRAAYGPRWADGDGNGCNQRDDVLLRDAHRGTAVVQRQGRCGHDVLAGTWTDPYTGRLVTLTDLKDRRQAAALQIDHVVPLAEAHRSGAAGWAPRRRELFANDLKGLRAVDGDLNQAKSDRDPAGWRPGPPAQCAYAEVWIGVKHAWQLAGDAEEKTALLAMLRRC